MPLTQRLNMFANNPLDRAGHLRTNEAWLASQIAANDALFVPLWRGDALILPEAAAGHGRDVAWLPKAAISAFLNNDVI
ncbi:MAG: NADH pyrophosphatase, partial [Alphaproteobacteria bacterium]|nr:NADH pyrophosphatase [Alphaproteobacteria bacterium]